jgi:hypothetical protein
LRGLRTALFNHFSGGRRTRQAIRDDPSTVFFDADRNRFIALFVEVLHDRGGGGDRDFVFA